MPRAFSISIQSDTVAAAAGLAVHRAGLGDHPGVQRERLGQRRLAGVGVADDGEGAAAAGLPDDVLRRWCRRRRRRRKGLRSLGPG